MRLLNKTALVTGGASGIGKAIAYRFAKEGANVVVADINQSLAEEVAAAINASGKKAFAIAMDVTSEKAVNEGMQRAQKQFGSLDILISNAGVQHIEAVHTLSYDNWKKVMSTNLDAAFLTTKAALHYMYQQPDGGAIIYMGSVHSKDASVLKAPYVSAKHGLLGLCRVVAKEGAAHKVRANVICPGFVKTPLVDKQIPEQAKELGISEEEVIKKIMLKNTVDGEFTTTEDVAEATLFFAEFKSNALTGQSLIVSHGWIME